jgi:hypothetical protein
MANHPITDSLTQSGGRSQIQNRPLTHNAAKRNRPAGGVGINPDSAIPRR